MAGELAKTDTTATTAAVSAVAAVTDTGGELPSRVGWEFWERPPLAPFPQEDQRSRYIPPLPPNPGLIKQKHEGKRTPGIALVCIGAFLVVVVAQPGPVLVGLALVALGIYLVIAGSLAVRRADNEFALATARAQSDHQAAVQVWQSQRDQWYADEARKVEALPVYYVLHQTDHRRRLDVFGGQVAGWASLLNTLARPLVDHGVDITVLDLTEASVAVELCFYAASRQLPMLYQQLPGGLPRVDLLRGFGAAEVAEVLVAAAHAVRDRRGREDEEHHEVDTAIVAEVCRLLEPGGLSVRRVVAGLDVANQVMGSALADALTPAERTAVEESGYLTATAARVRDRYAYLRPRLEAVAALATDPQAAVLLAPPGVAGAGSGAAAAVSVVAVDGVGRRERSFLANLVVQCWSQRLRDHRHDGPAPLVVVAGADLLTFDTVTTFSQRASRAGIRSMFLFANLEDDAKRLLGTDGADTLFFQLQNHEQAQAAADFIGRRHRFVVGQLTKSVADMLGGSHGENRSWSTGVTDTVGDSVTYGGLFKFFADNTSKSVSTAVQTTEGTGTQWSDSWQKTETFGETATRVYEYDTEPRTIQELDTSCFVFVSRRGGRTKVAVGDCNPGLERVRDVVAYPRELCPHRPPPPA